MGRVSRSELEERWFDGSHTLNGFNNLQMSRTAVKNIEPCYGCPEYRLIFLALSFVG